jgi:hypothetical protein
MRTLSEKRIVQKRRAQGILVPLLEELFREPVKIETEEDAAWMHRLMEKSIEREEIRRTQDGVFSPSSLAACIRKVYLTKNWKQLGFERIEVPRIEANGYFTKGDFVHLQWQFALYKLGQRSEEFELIPDGHGHHLVEVRVMSKRGDHGGTIDAIGAIRGEPVIIDPKGVHLRTFQQAVRGNVEENYRIQVVDYGILANAGYLFVNGNPFRLKKRIERTILLYESKAGPDPYHPLALTEVVIPLKPNIPEVRLRLGVLREHEAKKEIPKPECETTTTLQFQGCPFSEFCRKEVKAIERKNRKAKSGDSKGLRIAKPDSKRSNRSRRS